MSKTVLILGAGLSRAAMPNSASGNHLPPLDVDFFKTAKAINPKIHGQITKYLNERVGDYSESLQNSLESTIAYLYLRTADAAGESKERIIFADALQLLCDVISKTTDRISVGRSALLTRFIRSEMARVARFEDLSIITFNYDIAVERSLSAINSTKDGTGCLFFPGCYRMRERPDVIGISGQKHLQPSSHSHTGVSLLKLHGSLNWASTHTSRHPTKDALLSVSRKLHVLNASSIPGRLSWKRSSRTTYVKPIIVPPITGKRGAMHKNILPLWALAAEKLKAANRVIIVGYSCPPNDLEARFLLSESLRNNDNKRLYVVDRSPASAAKFVELCGVQHVTTYTDLNAWVNDAKTRL